MQQPPPAPTTCRSRLLQLYDLRQKVRERQSHCQLESWKQSQLQSWKELSQSSGPTLEGYAWQRQSESWQKSSQQAWQNWQQEQLQSRQAWQEWQQQQLQSRQARQERESQRAQTTQDIIKCRWYLRCAQQLGIEVTTELALLEKIVISICVGNDVDPSVYADFWPRFVRVGDLYNDIRSTNPERVARVEQTVLMGPAAVPSDPECHDGQQ